MNEKSREQKARRELNRLGYSLKKSRTKKTHINNMGGYMIIMNSCNGVVAGFRFELELDEVESWIHENG